MINIKDHTGKIISIPSPPQRIVSLVPSQTELLYDLGLEERVVGITKFCVHPKKWFEAKKRVGGTKNLNNEIIKSLQPDLIIANKEENVKTQIASVEAYCPVFTTHVFDLQSAIKMIHDVGIITQTHETAEALSATILEKFITLSFGHSSRALYLIWRKPYMAAGRDTFISEMMKYAGFVNCMAQKDRYPEVSVQDIIDLNPDIILLSSEPYPFTEIHIDEIRSILPTARIILVNGEYFSWYGSRLLQSPSYFKSIFMQVYDTEINN
jgi:ABC-type Fe3+-hydroxamate transport system substrate-binding protein